MSILDKKNVVVYTPTLYPGMMLKSDGFDEGGKKVINKETPLTDSLIQQLVKNGIKKITYTTQKVRLKKAVSRSMIDDSNLEQAYSVLTDIEESIRKNNFKLPEIELHDVVDGFVENIKDNNDAFLNLLDIAEMDEYTYSHSINVSAISILLSHALNLDREKTHHVGLAGLLLDIGKSMVPKEILYKKGRLDNSEWRIMLKHPIYGYNILKSETKIPEPVLKGVLLHHEWYKGGGYPFGFNHEKCNFVSQIIAVGDVFDASTSARTYHEPEDFAEAFTFIMENSGVKFEPHYAQTFLREMQKKINEQPLYPEGSYVILNTGEVAYVMGYRDTPYTLRPIVNIFFSPDKKVNVLKFHIQVDLEQDYQRHIIKRVTHKYNIRHLEKLRYGEDYEGEEK